MFGFSSPAALHACVAAGWSPGIGDPDAAGWLTVGSYGLCLCIAIAVLWRGPAGAARGLWGAIAVLMAVLGVNKQLDLQSALTAAGRCLARIQGWYEARGEVQLAFILGLLVAAGMSLGWAAGRLRGRLSSNGAALLGLAVLSAFVLVRAVGFHHVDRLISMDLGRLRCNFLFENAGLALIALNGAWLLRAPRPGSGPGDGRGPAPRPSGFRPSRPSARAHRSADR